MAFPSDFLDELRARLTLSGVVGRRVKLMRRGREFTGLCPFHNEKTPSFTVSDDKSFFHCFGCGEHGDVISFVQKTEGLSFAEAVERLAGEAGLEVPRASPEAQAREQRRAGLIEVVAAAARWFQSRLFANEGQAARDYLTSRGLSAETVQAFGLGFAPGKRGALLQDLSAQGLTPAQLQEAGLIKQPEDGGAPRDYFFNRIVFPIRDRRGRVIAFGGRAMGDSPAKYLNSPETPLFHKGQVLFNLDGARAAAQNRREIIVAEGYMDVIALCQAGFPGAVAPLGTAITEAQIQELWRLAREPILCLDGDRAGRQAAFRAVDRALGVLKPGHSLQFALLPAGEDPDSLVQSQGPQAMRDLLGEARPMVELLWLREVEGKPSDTPERRAALRQALRQAVQAIPDGELRKDYQRELARRFEAAFESFPRGDRAFGFSDQGRRGGFYGKSGGQPGTRSSTGRRQGDWAGAASYGVAASYKVNLRRRREQALLAGLLNHPDLLLGLVEELAAVEFQSADLSRLAVAMVDQAAQALGEAGEEGGAKPTNSAQNSPAHLDREALRCHLSDQGFVKTLAGLATQDVYVHGAFARPDAPKEAARVGLLHVLSLFRGQSAAADTHEAKLELESQMTEENLARLQAKQKLNQNSQTDRHDLDRYDAAKQSDQH